MNVSETVKERAAEVVKAMGETGQIMKVAWAMEIEKAIQATIEDCAKIADKEAEERANGWEYLSEPDDRGGRDSSKKIAEQIRALK
jgi:hypothetical protein